MKCDLLNISERRIVTNCGNNIYRSAELHPDRIMQEHDLLYIVSGEWSICQDDENYQLKQDDLMFLRSGSHHYSLSRCAIGTQTMFVHFTSLQTDVSVELSTRQSAQCMTGDTVCIPTVTNCQGQSSIRQYMRTISEQYWSERGDHIRQLSILLELLLNEISFTGCENQMLNEDWFVRVTGMIHTHPNRMFSLDEVAKVADMSVRTLTNRFKKTTGQSVYQYQLNLKLEMALARMRSDPTRTLTELAQNFGFYDAYQFSKLFKAKFGVPPRRYEQMK